MFGGIIHVGEALNDVIYDIDRWKDSNQFPRLCGLGTGFSNVDSLTLGIRPGSLSVIASRPSIGKSVFALNIATHVALNEHLPVLIFNPDSSSMLIAKKLLSRLSGIELTKIITCELSEEDLRRIDDSREILMGLPLFIDKSPILSVETIINRIQLALTRCDKLGLIIIDHLHLIDTLCSEDASSEDYEQVCSDLKNFAQKISVPIILVSPLNRNLERRRDKRPLVSDLPDRVVAQYSDLLMLLYRDEIYNPDSDRKGLMEICIPRNRYGRTGGVFLETARLKFGELIPQGAAK